MKGIKAPRWDKPKSLAQIEKELGKTCKSCSNPLTNMQGEGSSTLCREHQLKLVSYGGMGRIDRPHTFHRSWICTECGYDVLADPRLTDIDDEMTKRRVARSVMHGDHVDTRSSGGSDLAENISGLCVICHAKKTILNKDYLRNK